MRDKRRHPRIKLELKLTYTPEDLKNKIQGRASCEDISKSGALIKMDADQPIGGLIIGSILIPGESEPIRFEARVAWARPSDKVTKRAGLEFTNMTDIDRKRLEKAIERVWVQMMTFY